MRLGTFRLKADLLGRGSWQLWHPWEGSCRGVPRGGGRYVQIPPPPTVGRGRAQAGVRVWKAGWGDSRQSHGSLLNFVPTVGLSPGTQGPMGDGCLVVTA